MACLVFKPELCKSCFPLRPVRFCKVAINKVNIKFKILITLSKVKIVKTSCFCNKFH